MTQVPNQELCSNLTCIGPKKQADWIQKRGCKSYVLDLFALIAFDSVLISPLFPRFSIITLKYLPEKRRGEQHYRIMMSSPVSSEGGIKAARELPPSTERWELMASCLSPADFLWASTSHGDWGARRVMPSLCDASTVTPLHQAPQPNGPLHSQQVLEERKLENVEQSAKPERQSILSFMFTSRSVCSRVPNHQND